MVLGVPIFKHFRVFQAFMKYPLVCLFLNLVISLSIGTPNTTTFPFVPNGKWWLLGVPIFEHIIIRL